MEGSEEEIEQPIEVPEEEIEDFEDYGPTDEDYSEEEDFEFGGSEPEPLGGIYGLFKNVKDSKDTKRVSNLKDDELGMWDLSVRDCERVALISKTFRHPGVQKFFISQSRIITDTAMSRKGWFAELFVTSKKYASRDSSSSVLGLPQTQKKDKWKIFSSKEPQPLQNM